MQLTILERLRNSVLPYGALHFSRHEACKAILSRRAAFPPDRFARARTTVFTMPDNHGEFGRLERLEDRRLPMHLVIASLALAGVVTLVAILLSIAATAAHIPMR